MVTAEQSAKARRTMPIEMGQSCGGSDEDWLTKGSRVSCD